MNTEFDVLDENQGLHERMQESLLRATKQRGNVKFSSLADVQDDFLEFHPSWVIPQIMLGRKGLKSKSVVEIIGGDGVGKTSLAFSIVGQFMDRYNSPVLYIETESKKMDNNRIQRCLHNNGEKSKKMLKAMHYMFSSSLVDTIFQLESWAEVCRNELHISLDIPLVIVIDSYSKLQNQAEAEGRVVNLAELSDDKKAKIEKFIVGDSSMKDNLGHAKITQQWCRCLPRFCHDLNVLLITVNHQNTQISSNAAFGGGGGSFVPEEVKQAYNRTKIGGNALNQNASLQLIVNRTQFVVQAGVKVADRCKATIAKNSYGPKGKEFFYDIEATTPEVSPGVYRSAISFHRTLVDYLKLNPIPGIQVPKTGKGKFTWEAQGIVTTSAAAFSAALMENTAALNSLYDVSTADLSDEQESKPASESE